MDLNKLFVFVPQDKVADFKSKYVDGTDTTYDKKIAFLGDTGALATRHKIYGDDTDADDALDDRVEILEDTEVWDTYDAAAEGITPSEGTPVALGSTGLTSAQLTALEGQPVNLNTTDSGSVVSDELADSTSTINTTGLEINSSSITIANQGQ